ncbi:stage V sporulation protein AA [Thermoflavimicrobium dichotomicum]|uniref:Stage V sporulation protein AA n=1 Tax=Thermoflavimicrobium dichotomicum TaxID=46223 RepID=A0A1I3Q5D8_9BACL|nr:stage V sporulation protein AA [Thermoflavimicrobium dichotomicum]SFJ28627.1 stage V sporulation protein AA [Thermoflavimicrobium dichotomicum]
METVIYLRLKKKVLVQCGQLLRLKDICYLVADEKWQYLQDLPIHTVDLAHGNYALIELREVIERIRQHVPQADLRNIGPLQTIVEIMTPIRIPKKLSIVLIWIFLFTGSGLAIMNFHTDVNMKEVHERIYYLVTGEKEKNPLVLQIPYSIGIGVGMILFFNHLFKKRFNEEPSPMELEMFLYQEAIDQFIIDDEKQKAERKDYDGSP